jgi:hypothetical protein
MARDNHEKLYEILLDVQKQIGHLGNETSKQSEMLIALNNKVAIANGRTTKNEEMLAKHQSILDDWKGKLAVIVVIVGFAGNLLISWIKKSLDL